MDTSSSPSRPSPFAGRGRTEPELGPVQLSRLESLPAELLERIFFYSLEVNLPRASLHIARILSQPIIYKWLIRLAFSSSNQSAKTDFFTPDFLPPPLDYWALNTAERANLQTAILACRWSTLSLFRQCQREYVKQILRKKCGNLVFSAEDQAKLDNLDYYLARPMDFDLALDGRRGSGDLVLKAKVKKDDIDSSSSSSNINNSMTTTTTTTTTTNSNKQSDLRIAFWFHFGSVQIHEPSGVSHKLDSFQLPCAPAIDEPPRMPDKLLHEPWTAEKLELLTLFSHEAYIDEDNNYLRSRRVLRQLIRDRDHATFERLLELSIKTKNYSYPTAWPVKTRHFRAALKYAQGPNDPFVRLLYDHRWHVLGERDREIKEAFLENLNMLSRNPLTLRMWSNPGI